MRDVPNVVLCRAVRPTPLTAPIGTTHRCGTKVLLSSYCAVVRFWVSQAAIGDGGTRAAVIHMLVHRMWAGGTGRVAPVRLRRMSAIIAQPLCP